MIVNCPKCGFSQPQDQYCAKCGVDMVAFRPKPKPLARRVLSHTLFQLSVLIGLIVTLFFTVQYQHQARLQSRIADVENAGETRILSAATGDDTNTRRHAQPEVVNAKGLVSKSRPASAETAKVAAAVAESQSLVQPAVPTSNDEMAASIDAESNPTVAGGNSADKDATGPPSTLRIVFAEIPQEHLAGLFSERNVASYGGSVTTGVVPQLSRYLDTRNAANSRWINLDKSASTTRHDLKINRPIMVFKGARDEETDQNLGLTFQVTPLEPTTQEENVAHLQVDVLRVLREADSRPPVSDQAFQERFSIPRSGAAFMTGLFPRRSLERAEMEFYSRFDVLKVMTHPQFISGTSEFVVFFEAE